MFLMVKYTIVQQLSRSLKMGNSGVFGVAVSALLALASIGFYSDTAGDVIKGEKARYGQALASTCELRMAAFGGPVDQDACRRSAAQRLGR